MIMLNKEDILRAGKPRVRLFVPKNQSSCECKGKVLGRTDMLLQ